MRHEICLKCEDLQASKQFYASMGMDVISENEYMVHLTNGNLHISLMGFLEHNMITLRGADVQALHAAMATHQNVTGEPEQYTKEQMGADGNHWKTQDPDGNVVYFDTTDAEATKAARVESLLSDLERCLDMNGLESNTFQAFKAELQEKYGSS